MMEFITPDVDGNVKIPNRAARYTVDVKGIDSEVFEKMSGVVQPDGSISGVNAETAATEFRALEIEERRWTPTVTVENGVVFIDATGISFRLSPVDTWRNLTPAHQLASRYTMDIAQCGHSEWTPGRGRDRERTAGEVSALVRKTVSGGGDAAVSDTGVIIIEQESTAVRYTPVITPAYRREYWSATEVGKHLRSQLRKAFPGQKISVRNGRGTGYGYLDVRWTGGPSKAEVKQICDPWQGGDFDGMTDMMVSRSPLLVMKKDGELVEVKPVTELISYERSRPAGVEEQAKTLVHEQTGHSWRDATPFQYQGVRFYGSTPWDQLRKVMDAIEAGDITVNAAADTTA
ncbi:LPD29 domain-containing protein [Streptomyces noursei]|uniref:LPD29 domain-containing protein n=1 Tax=Streptomyces noursei TaxID=1971 RepID=UPI0035D872F7